MGSATSINVPAWQVDLEGHITHRYGNDKTRAELKSRLLQHDYSALIIEAGEVNKSMKEAIFSVIGSRGVVDESDTEASMSKRRAAIELIVGHLTRLRNPKRLNFFVVVLSALALGYGVPVAFWSLLTFMALPLRPSVPVIVKSVVVLTRWTAFWWMPTCHGALGKAASRSL